MHLPKKLLAILALLLIPAVAHAASLPDVLSAGAVGITIGFLFAGLGYMVSGFIGTPQAQGWAKNEVFENFYTLFIVVNIGILGLACLVFFAVFPSVAQPSVYPVLNQPQLQLDLNYITSHPIMTNEAITQINLALDGDPNAADLLNKDNVIQTSSMGIKSLFLRAYMLEVTLGEWAYIGQIHFNTLSAASTAAGTGGGVGATDKNSISAPLFPGLTKVVDVLEQMNELLILVIFMLLAHQGVLMFIHAVGPQILLIGIFFRCLPFTRRLGSTLMALFITLQFVYPAFILTTFSDQFYGKITRDFGGAYVNSNWFSGLPNVDGLPIQYIGPRTIVIADNDTKSVNLSFVGFPSQYDYTVKTTGSGTEICSSKTLGRKAVAGEQIDCQIDVTKLTAADLIKDEDKPDLGIYEYTISISFTADKVDEKTFGITPDYPYTKDLKVMMFVIKPCVTTECDQKLILRNAEYGEIMDSYLADQMGDDSTYVPGATADGITLASKFATHVWSDQALKKASALVVQKTIKTGTKQVVKSGLAKVGGAVASGPGLIASFLLSSATIKSDIATGMFDEIACDAYTGRMAEAYIGLPPSGTPEVDSSQMTFYQKAWKGVASAGDFMVSTGGELRDDYVKMYGKSDYTSCASSIGALNWLVGKMTMIGSGQSTPPREFNITVLMTRAVLAFMISLFAVIVSVTFFRSISESIGGDASLMGLGKLI